MGGGHADGDQGEREGILDAAYNRWEGGAWGGRGGGLGTGALRESLGTGILGWGLGTGAVRAGLGTGILGWGLGTGAVRAGLGTGILGWGLGTGSLREGLGTGLGGRGEDDWAGIGMGTPGGGGGRGGGVACSRWGGLWMEALLIFAWACDESQDVNQRGQLLGSK